MLVIIIISKISSDTTGAGYTPRNSCTRAKVKGLYESRLTIRGGTKLGILSPLRRFGQEPLCSTHHLVRQREMLKEESVHGCRGAKHKTYCLLDDPCVIQSASKAFCYLSSRGNAISWAPDPSKFVNKITVKDWVGYSFSYIFLKRYSTKFW